MTLQISSKQSKANAPGVICFEGEWEEAIDDLTTVEPSMRLLENLGLIRFVHRTVSTSEEFDYQVDRWLRTRKRGYDFCYFAFHGSPGEISLGRDNVNLEQLAEVIAGRCSGKILHFASCQVMKLPDEELIKFCALTGATAITGYTTRVDWLESAAFELLLVSDLTGATKMKSAYERLSRKYPDLSTKLGFRLATYQQVFG